MTMRSAAIHLSDEIRVQPATLRDARALHRLERRCFPLDSWPLVDILASLLMPRIIRFKATDGPHITGFALGDRGDDAGWVATLGVDPDYRRRGIGAALLEAVESGLDVPVVRLCVRHSNDDAIRLYKRFGYLTVNVWQGYYRGGEDALVMEKYLG